MKHYTDTIPLELVKKLREVGMPLPLYQRGFEDVDGGITTTYAEVFDWLMDKDINISVVNRVTSLGIGFFPSVNGLMPECIDGRHWHHSADMAIEKAIELIKEE